MSRGTAPAPSGLPLVLGLILGAFVAEAVRGCPAKADMGSDVSQIVRELAGIRRALESGKCGGR